MHATNLQRLRTRHEAYMISWRASGKDTRTYDTPCCGKELETTAPADAGEVWDSLTTCPYCGGLHFKIVTTEGVVAKAMS